jgi:hypothetical protein
MKGDFTRFSFDRRKHYGGVLMQQGRVPTDADWNEQEAIERHRARALARDLIGPCGGPRAGAGFAIGLDRARLVIGAGRYWVDGILAENEAEVAYDVQPDLPDPPDWRASGRPRRALVYLDVWDRYITAIEDPSLREPALGGPDTSGRVKTVWQVRVLPLVAREGDPCGAGSREWAELVADRGARLAVRIGSGGYEGIENHLYRVEVHRPGRAGKARGATFKWSRDNASLVAAVRGNEGKDLLLGERRPLDVLPFTVGRWVELSDDRSELGGVAGELVQAERVDEVAGRVTVSDEPTVLSSAGGALDLARHPKVRAWDQAEGATRDGLPAADGWIRLENGIEVRFPGGTYRTGDYWTFPARTADRSIEWPSAPSGYPEPRPPQGIEHRYCPLALIERRVARAAWRVVGDCRRLFNPLLSP